MSSKKENLVSKEVKWPVVPGTYIVGDTACSVAICTLSSKIKMDLPFAIKGTCMTENIGIEKVILNLISNPHIRFLILCGDEVPGHYTGACLKALLKYGIAPDSKKIRKALGPIPILGNLPIPAIERFRHQVEIVDLIGINDPLEIQRMSLNCVQKKVEKYPAPPFIVQAKPTMLQPEIISYNVSILPEYRIGLDPFTSRVGREVKITIDH